VIGLLKRSSAALSVLLTGVAVELFLAVAKNEPLDLERFLTLFGFIAVVFLVVEVATRRQVGVRALVAGGLFAIGFLAVAIGVTALYSPRLADNQILLNVVGSAVISSGALVFMSGMYVRRQRGVVTTDDAFDFRDREGGQPRGVGGAPQVELVSFADVPDTMLRLCRGAVSANDLHFVAYYVDEECVFYLHALNDPALSDMIGKVTATTRRKRYEAYGRLTHRMVRRLDGSFQEVRQQELIRVVLDVRQGAFYYCRIDDYRFIFGVTLDQDKVDEADDKMRDIAYEAEKASGQVPEGGFHPQGTPPPATSAEPAAAESHSLRIVPPAHGHATS
jgi:hypothetical protein